ncbi:MAG: hypothetical protein KJS98_16405, partial [Nitrospirae bacterium]|nr:hypothetical protein [Nitrospirota bacterium]
QRFTSLSYNKRPHVDVGLAMSTMVGYALDGMLSRCRTATCGQKKIASDFCLLEDCSLRAWKVLRDHQPPYHERIGFTRADSE